MSRPVEPRVIRAANPSPMTLDGTRTHLVGHRRCVVIDPGPAGAAHLDALAAAVAEAEEVTILLTHAHPDHAAGAVALADRLRAPLRMAHGALDLPFPETAVDRWIEDGVEIGTDAGPITAVATPGHAPEHLAFWWPEAGALFAGDLFMGEGDTTLVAPPEGDLGDYLRSLDRVAALRPEVLYPAHGPPLAPALEAVARFRAHREARVRQVEEALGRHPGAGAEELVDEIYGSGLHPALRGAAAGSVRAVLALLRGGRSD